MGWRLRSGRPAREIPRRSATSACAPTATSSTSRSRATFATIVDDPYVEPGFTRAPLTDEVDVAVIGGGFGGLLAGARCARPASRTSASSRRAATSAAPGTGTAIPAPSATSRSYIYLPLLEETGYMPKEKYSFAPEILEHCQRIGEHFDLYRRRLLPDRGHRAALGRDERPLDRHHQPRRRDEGALRGHGQRAAEPAEAARHPRHRDLQGPHLPHQPLGLRLHRRRHHRRPDQPGRQARRRSSAPARPRSSACRTSASPPSSSTSSSARPRRSTCAATGRPIRNGPRP